MARKRLLGVAEAAIFKLYIEDMLRDRKSRHWHWFTGGSYELEDELDGLHEINSCPLYDVDTLAKLLKNLPEGISELPTVLTYDPYELERLIALRLYDGKSFDDLYKAFCNKQRQAKSRAMGRDWNSDKGIKKLDTRRKSAMTFKLLAEENGKSKLDTMDEIAETMKILCRHDMTISDLRDKAQYIKEMLEEAQQIQDKKTFNSR
ncbi:MAG: hypothetical protein ACI92E_001336 [Oceanicoccus sp.]|jgi:hypothetical protein